MLVIGLATGFGSEPSAEPTAQAFLLDWQQQHYAAAGALTSASPGTAAADLKDAFAQLDATQLFLTMNSVTQHGGTAEASFTASVDLAEEGRVWAYHGRFGLSRVGGTWKVQWAPSVVYPGLGPGERLAVVTQFPDRAAVLDAEGQPLQVPSLVYVVGVVPDALADPAATAQRFADVTELEAGQVLGQITAAPPNQFLKLASLDPATYSSCAPGFAACPASWSSGNGRGCSRPKPPGWSARWATRSTRSCATKARSTCPAPRSGCPGWNRSISVSSSARRRPRSSR